MTTTWKHASGCDASSDNCVEVAHLDEGVVCVRDSTDPTVVQHYGDAEWDTFVAGVKAGEFDRA